MSAVQAEALAPSDVREGDTLIWGAAGIGREINRDPRQAFHLLETRKIRCARKIGHRWTAWRLALRHEMLGGA